MVSRTFVSSTSITYDVGVSIHKESAGGLSYVHNVTLRAEGTDAVAMNYSVFTSPQVDWLELPPITTLAASDLQVDTLVPLLFSAVGLAEQVEPYTTTVHFIGQSLLSSNQKALGVPPLSSAFEMPVTLSVSATTSTNTTTWGKLNADQGRVGCAAISRPGVLQVRVGQTVEQSFTACDVEALPVNHPLPGVTDPRTFGAQLTRVTRNGARKLEEAVSTTAQVVVYASAGVYDVQVAASPDALIGLYKLTLALDAEPIAGHVDVQVNCPEGLIELADGVSCGCEAGQYLEGVVCSPCTAGTYSGNGSSSCTDCSEGTFSFAGAAACEACPAGTFTPDTGQAVCMPWCAH